MRHPRFDPREVIDAFLPLLPSPSEPGVERSPSTSSSSAITDPSSRKRTREIQSQPFPQPVGNSVLVPDKAALSCPSSSSSDSLASSDSSDSDYCKKRVRISAPARVETTRRRRKDSRGLTATAGQREAIGRQLGLDLTDECSSAACNDTIPGLNLPSIPGIKWVPAQTKFAVHYGNRKTSFGARRIGVKATFLKALEWLNELRKANGEIPYAAKLDNVSTVSQECFSISPVAGDKPATGTVKAGVHDQSLGLQALVNDGDVPVDGISESLVHCDIVDDNVKSPDNEERLNGVEAAALAPYPKGVIWARTTSRWFAVFNENGKKKFKTFDPKKPAYGTVAAAYDAAIEFMKEVEPWGKPSGGSFETANSDKAVHQSYLGTKDILKASGSNHSADTNNDHIHSTLEESVLPSKISFDSNEALEQMEAAVARLPLQSMEHRIRWYRSKRGFNANFAGKTKWFSAFSRGVDTAWRLANEWIKVQQRISMMSLPNKGNVSDAAACDPAALDPTSGAVQLNDLDRGSVTKDIMSIDYVTSQIEREGASPMGRRNHESAPCTACDDSEDDMVLTQKVVSLIPPKTDCLPYPTIASRAKRATVNYVNNPQSTQVAISDIATTQAIKKRNSLASKSCTDFSELMTGEDMTREAASLKPWYESVTWNGDRLRWEFIYFEAGMKKKKAFRPSNRRRGAVTRSYDLALNWRVSRDPTLSDPDRAVPVDREVADKSEQALKLPPIDGIEWDPYGLRWLAFKSNGLRQFRVGRRGNVREAWEQAVAWKDDESVKPSRRKASRNQSAADEQNRCSTNSNDTSRHADLDACSSEEPAGEVQVAERIVLQTTLEGHNNDRELTIFVDENDGPRNTPSTKGSLLQETKHPILFSPALRWCKNEVWKTGESRQSAVIDASQSTAPSATL